MSPGRTAGKSMRHAPGVLCLLGLLSIQGLAGCGVFSVAEQQKKLHAALQRPGALWAPEDVRIISLDDPRFSRASADDGLWRPFDFLREDKAGLYFLEPFDPSRTPVLFVHGVRGTPEDFKFLTDRLDSRFQAWLYYYPSGLHLDTVAARLDQTIQTLRRRYRLANLLVVGHSVGGLVSRSFILRQAESRPAPRIPVFVSIATPWAGVKAAELGIKLAPSPVWVWYDVVPRSAFLTRLFYEGGSATTARRRLPSHTAYHLVATVLPTRADDGRVSSTSQLRREAKEDAVDVHTVAQSHTGVLRDARTSQLINAVLAAGASSHDGSLK